MYNILKQFVYKCITNKLLVMLCYIYIYIGMLRAPLREILGFKNAHEDLRGHAARGGTSKYTNTNKYIINISTSLLYIYTIIHIYIYIYTYIHTYICMYIVCL